MVIVAGRLILKNGARDRFLAASEPAVRLARCATGCRDFAVSADLIDPNRINVYEEWETRDDLTRFRESGPDAALMDLIVEVRVREFVVADADGRA